MAGDIKPKLLATQSLVSSGLNSLAASTSRLTGYETNAVDNGAYSGGPCADYLVGGYFTAGSANHNAGQIDISVVGALNDTPTWPDVFDGTAGAETVTSANIFAAVCKPVGPPLFGDSSNARVYPFGPIGIAQSFGGYVPDQWALFIAHNIHTSTNAWASSGHEIWYTPVLDQYT